MFKTKKRLRMENLVLRTRIQVLEEKLCPSNQHQWVLEDHIMSGCTGHGDETTIYRYRCSRCSKVKDSIYPIL